ncbi:phage holin family protein [Paenarthrobacter histidinolovorans]|uniref:Membrane protein n=1 Tax=Paenarthrobacter histidinolovorans TaxID=43664 RepID=A0ABW8NCT2_9MICC
MSSPADLPPTEAHMKAETLPLGELLSDLTRDVSTLMRQEVELAKVELKESATKAGKGAGMMAGAAWAGHITMLFLSIALWWALGLLVGLGWSAVIVAVIWGIIAAVLAVMGRKELNAIKGMPRTAETVKEIPPALKPNTEETR